MKQARETYGPPPAAQCLGVTPEGSPLPDQIARQVSLAWQYLGKRGQEALASRLHAEFAALNDDTPLPGEVAS